MTLVVRAAGLEVGPVRTCKDDVGDAVVGLLMGAHRHHLLRWRHVLARWWLGRERRGWRLWWDCHGAPRGLSPLWEGKLSQRGEVWTGSQLLREGHTWQTWYHATQHTGRGFGVVFLQLTIHTHAEFRSPLLYRRVQVTTRIQQSSGHHSYTTEFRSPLVYNRVQVTTRIQLSPGHHFYTGNRKGLLGSQDWKN